MFLIDDSSATWIPAIALPRDHRQNVPFFFDVFFLLSFCVLLLCVLVRDRRQAKPPVVPCVREMKHD